MITRLLCIPSTYLRISSYDAVSFPAYSALDEEGEELYP